MPDTGQGETVLKTCVCVLTFRRAAVAYRAPMDFLAVSFRFPSLLMVLLTVDKDSQYSYPF